MQLKLLQYLRCPITQQPFTIKVLRFATKKYNNVEEEIVEEGILFSNVYCYPIIKGVPRLLIETVVDYEYFLKKNIPDFANRKNEIYARHKDLIEAAIEKNKHTKKSFAQEWSLFNYEKDTTWNANPEEMLTRFLTETNETAASIKGKVILDAGCGNGLLNSLIANAGAVVIGFDFSLSVETAFEKNSNANAMFIQADVQFAPVTFDAFDIVHCSGVLIHTNNTQYSFNKLIPFVKNAGKLSVWLYHPRKNFIHNCFNFIRKYSSKLPLKLQYYLYLFFLLPPTYIIKKAKRNPQNIREMMIDILDWMTPQFRWEHTHEEATGWFKNATFNNIKITTNELFGFNIIGEKTD